MVGDIVFFSAIWSGDERHEGAVKTFSPAMLLLVVCVCLCICLCVCICVCTLLCGRVYMSGVEAGREDQVSSSVTLTNKPQ